MDSLKCSLTVTLIILSITTRSQDQGHKNVLFISGVVYDMETLEIIPFTTISINRTRHILSDQNGHFEAYSGYNDTVTVNQPGYENSVISLNDITLTDDTLYLKILMKLQPHEIPGATILPFSSYSQFRTALINFNKYNSNDSNPARNMATILSQIDNDLPDADSYSNYKNTIIMKDLNNNAFIFLSSEPNKGLFGALKSIGIRMPWEKN